MSSKINTTVSGADTGQGGQEALPPVTVSMKKLTEGVTTMFMGIVQMLEALEPHVAQRLVDIAVQDAQKGQDVEDVQPTVSVQAINEHEGGENNASEVADDTTPAPSDGVPEASDDDTDQVSDTPAVTEDDITKIIVRKIKQNRSNNEKIGSILKAYGVAKVSELPTSKYEAFLTDVSQL